MNKAFASAMAYHQATVESQGNAYAKLRAVLRLSLDALFIVNAQGTIEDASDSVERVFGWQPQELVGQSIRIIMPDPHHSQHDGYIQQYLETGQSQMMGRLRRFQAVRKDGTDFPCEVAVSRVDVPGRSAPAFTGLVRDVTQQVTAEEKLEALNKQLTHAARRIGMAETASSVLHNVGNVLNSLCVSLGILEEKARNGTVSDLFKLADIVEQHLGDFGEFVTHDERGRHLPECLLQMSRQAASEQEQLQNEVRSLTKNTNHIKSIIAVQQSNANVSGLIEEVSPAELIEDAICINSASAERHRITIIREIDDVPMLRTDKQKVLQILINLVSNAKYALIESDQQDQKIQIRLQSRDDRIRIEVQDNGIGIAADVRDKLFTHGFTTRKEGHGFGLHSAAMAAGELGGTLSASSDGLGKGAVFALEVPIRADTSDGEATLGADTSASVCR
ncbi:MAG: PAS domain-containing sensor histidine kinase [Planctomycetia bacterium]|nr:PAS domain-containing sensor histidine kinase [Planctomycetia bacterium]